MTNGELPMTDDGKSAPQIVQRLHRNTVRNLPAALLWQAGWSLAIGIWSFPAIIREQVRE
jgi:hypothetical protein